MNIKDQGTMREDLDNLKMDSNHNQLPKDRLCLPDLIKTGSISDIKHAVVNSYDVDEVNAAGDTALHVAVATGQYNTTVILLNRGCSLEIRNKEGKTAKDLAQTIEGRTVFNMAIQLTQRNRREKMKTEEKKKLIQQERERKQIEEMDYQDGDHEIDEVLKLSNKILNSRQSLTSAKKLVKDLEGQVVTAKCLVNQLELDVQNLEKELEHSKKKKRSGSKVNKLPETVLTSCSVCLDVPRPPMKIYQCPEGHIFCDECQSRPELTTCPECRVPLDGVKIRNRTLEQLIWLASQ